MGNFIVKCKYMYKDRSTIFFVFILKIKCHRVHLNLWEALHASQDLHMTCGILFPNENEKRKSTSILNCIKDLRWCNRSLPHACKNLIFQIKELFSTMAQDTDLTGHPTFPILTMTPWKILFVHHALHNTRYKESCLPWISTLVLCF